MLVQILVGIGIPIFLFGLAFYAAWAWDKAEEEGGVPLIVIHRVKRTYWR